MNKNIIIIGLVAIVLLAGGTFFVLSGSSDDNNVQESTESQQDATEQPVFSGESTENLSFRATFSSTGGDDELKGLFEYDGAGTGRFSGEQGGETVELYYTKDDFITCQSGSCFSLSGDGFSPINQDQFNFSQEDFNEFQDTATYKGEQDCRAGRCNVWGYTDSEDGGTGEVFISTDNQRVSQVLGTDDDGTEFSLVYEYVPVTIELPDAVEQLPAGI